MSKHVLQIQLIVISEANILCVLLSQIKINMFNQQKHTISRYCRSWDEAGKSLLLFAALIFVPIKEWLHLKTRMLSLQSLCLSSIWSQCQCLYLYPSFILFLRNKKSSRSLSSFICLFPILPWMSIFLLIFQRLISLWYSSWPLKNKTK